MLDTQSQDNEQNELNGVGQALTNGDATVNGQEPEAKQPVIQQQVEAEEEEEEEEGREAEEAAAVAQSKPKRIETNFEMQEEEEANEDSVNGILSDRFFDAM